MEELKIKNPKVIPLEEYQGAQKKIRFKCANEDCDHEWLTTPTSVLQGCACRKCAGTLKYTHKEFLERLKNKNDKIEALSEYKGSNEKIHLLCHECGYEWYSAPISILRTEGKGCPNCYGNIIVSWENFLQELQKTNPTITIISKPEEYKNSKSKLQCRCGVCGHIWETNRDNLINSVHGCPQCRVSRGEKAVADYLEKSQIEFKIQQKFKECIDKAFLPFDLYIPSLNTLIEYQGEGHYFPVNFGGMDDEQAQKQFTMMKRHDEIKRNFCKDYNIDLLTISYLEFDIIEDVLEEYIDNRKAYIKQHPESLQGNAQAL